MEQHQQQPPAYIEYANQLGQAMFYCYNESSERLPVSRLSGFTFEDEQTLFFHTDYFPVTDNNWNVFAAELHFYKKGMPNSLILHGIAAIDNLENGHVQFSIKQAEYFENPLLRTDKSLLSSLVRPYIYFYRKSSELLQNTFKRKGTTGSFNKLSANA